MKRFIVFVFSLASCSVSSDFEENLTSCNKEWLYFDSNHNIDSIEHLIPVYYISFGKDRKWCNYFISDKSRNHLSDCHDWSYNERDSILSTGKDDKMKFKIYRYSRDTIYMKNFMGLKEYLINIKPLASQTIPTLRHD